MYQFQLHTVLYSKSRSPLQDSERFYPDSRALKRTLKRYHTRNLRVKGNCTHVSTSTSYCTAKAVLPCRLRERFYPDSRALKRYHSFQ